MKKLEERLEQFIKENGVMKKWVAEQLEISNSHLVNWLHGRVTISRTVEEKIKEFLRKKGY